MKYKVFFDDSIFHVQERGGISRYVLSLATALAQTGKVEVLVFGGWSKNQVLAEFQEIPGLRIVYRTRKTKLRINSFAEKISGVWRRWVFRSFVNKKDNVIYHSTYFRPDPFICKKSNLRVQTFYDMIPEMLADGSNNSNKHLGERSSIIGEMDVFASISQSTADDLVKYYPDSQGRITITHLAAELPASKHHELLPDVPYFLIVGNRGGYKNGDLALRAFSKIAKEHKKLLLVYFGGESISAEEYEFLEKEKLKDRVFRIRGEDALLSSAYEKAKALLYPSNYEGFGLPLLEAFQKGCPVITCENSSLPEVGGDAAIYVDPDDADVLAMEMENLLNATADDRAKLVGKGKAQELKFTWASTAQSTLSLYKIQ